MAKGTILKRFVNTNADVRFSVSVVSGSQAEQSHEAKLQAGCSTADHCPK